LQLPAPATSTTLVASHKMFRLETSEKNSENYCPPPSFTCAEIRKTIDIQAFTGKDNSLNPLEANNG